MSAIVQTVDYAVAKILGLYCSRCQRVTAPYIGEGEPLGYGSYADLWPCCSGCWQTYPAASRPAADTEGK